MSNCPVCGGEVVVIGLRIGPRGESLDGGFCTDCGLYLRRPTDTDDGWRVPEGCGDAYQH